MILVPKYALYIYYIEPIEIIIFLSNKSKLNNARE